MIRNLIFDVGGVLHMIDFERAYDTIAELKGISPEKVKESYFKHVDNYDRGNLTPEEFVSAFSKDAGIQMAEEEFFPIFVQNSRINRRLAKLIKDTLSERFSIYILSNNSTRNIEFFKKYSGLDGVAEEFFSNQYGTIKPEGRFYQILLEKTGINPENSVFIDDLEENLKTARRFGLKTILFQGNDQLVSDLRKIAPF